MLSLSRARALGVAGITALGLGTAGSLVEASVSLAAAPTSGSACNPIDGKINARGSTLQSWLQEDLIGAYASDVCGYVAAATSGTAPGNLQTDTGQLYFQDPNAGTGPATSFSLTDPTDPFTTSAETAANAAPYVTNADNTEPYYKSDYMISYNPYEAYNYSATGSTQGRAAISCRTDAFSGTDIPYVTKDWQDINAAAGLEATDLGKACQPSQPAAGAFVDTTFFPTAPATQPWLPAFETQPTGGFPQTSDPEGVNNPVVYNGSSQTGGLLSFPIGLSAVAFPINLQTGTNASGKAEYCGTTSTTKPVVNLSVADIAGLFGGVVSNYEQLDGGDGGYTLNGKAYNDTGENPSLASCNVTVTRITRYDGSGTTQAVLNFLNDAITNGDGTLSTAATCGSGEAGAAPYESTFGDLVSAVVNSQTVGSAGTNDLWPGELYGSGITKPVWTAASTNCTADIPGGSTAVGNTGVNGGPALLKTLESNSGGIGYADVSDVEHDANTANLILPKVENSTSASLSSTLGYSSGSTTYATAEGNSVSAKGSDCSLSGWTNPNGAGDMGLNGEWALDYGSAGTYNTSNYDDVAFKYEGSSYPACTLTWDFVWGNQGSEATSATDPQPELDADQRRTLYSYFTYVFSDAAQSTLPGAGYQQLPQSLIDQFRTEFQASF